MSEENKPFQCWRCGSVWGIKDSETDTPYKCMDCGAIEKDSAIESVEVCDCEAMQTTISTQQAKIERLEKGYKGIKLKSYCSLYDENVELKADIERLEKDKNELLEKIRIWGRMNGKDLFAAVKFFLEKQALTDSTQG